MDRKLIQAGQDAEKNGVKQINEFSPEPPGIPTPRRINIPENKEV